MRLSAPQKAFLPLAAAYLGLLAWSWMMWPDPVVDFGRELYVPWQLAQHRVLYRDIAYFGGALPPYLNCLWFLLFGASLRTLVVANAAIAGAILHLLQRLLGRIATPIGAAAGCAAFLGLFAVNQLAFIGNYNFICPYSHGMTHGTLAFLLALWGLSRFEESPTALNAGVVGLPLGLLFLIKADFFVAGAGAALTFFLSRRWAKPARRETAAGPIAAALLSAALLPALAAFALLARQMPPEQALRGTLGEWVYIFGTPVVRDRFYLWSSGILDWPDSLWRLAVATLILALLVALGAALGRPTSDRGRGKRRRAWAERAVALLVAASVFADYGVCQYLWSALPVFLAALALWTGIQMRAHGKAAPERRPASTRLAVIVGAGLLLGKILLFTRTYHYGFALAMPGTLVAVAALVDWIPEALRRRGWSGGPLRWGSVVALSIVICGHLHRSQRFYSEKRCALGRGSDAFRADFRGCEVQAALDRLDSSLRPADSFAVLPEGVMLNYLARRPAPSRFVSWVPADVEMFGEERMAADLRSSRPESLVLINRDEWEYGRLGFGEDYGLAVRSWIEREYALESSQGAPASDPADFGIQIYRRRDVRRASGGTRRP